VVDWLYVAAGRRCDAPGVYEWTGFRHGGLAIRSELGVFWSTGRSACIVVDWVHTWRSGIFGGLGLYVVDWVHTWRTGIFGGLGAYVVDWYMRLTECIRGGLVYAVDWVYTL
jgi:hypothetical protein